MHVKCDDLLKSGYKRNCTILSSSTFLRLFLKPPRDCEFLRSTGSEFHNLGAEKEKKRSYTVVVDLGTARVPLVDDLK